MSAESRMTDPRAKKGRRIHIKYLFMINIEAQVNRRIAAATTKMVELLRSEHAETIESVVEFCRSIPQSIVADEDDRVSLFLAEKTDTFIDVRSRAVHELAILIHELRPHAVVYEDRNGLTIHK
jgi:hypothetical protein